MNHYLRLFHQELRVHASKRNRVIKNRIYKPFSQAELYRDLFAWQLTGTKARTEELDEGQISRWLNCKEAVPESIASRTAHDRKVCVQKYTEVFQRLAEEGLFGRTDTQTKLMSRMEAFINDWNPVFLLLPRRGLSHTLAEALTNSLLLDYALRGNRLSPALHEKLTAAVALCKAHNAAFKTPYLLSVILEGPASLLWRTLNTLSPGAGDAYGKAIQDYRNSKEHGDPFAEVDLDREKLLVTSRVLSFLAGKDLTDEYELCAGLQAFHAKSLTKMRDIAGAYWQSQDLWRDLLEKCRERQTSAQYFEDI